MIQSLHVLSTWMVVNNGHLNMMTLTNMHFPTLQDAYLFYREYGRIRGFNVRKSIEKSDWRGNLLAKYIQCSQAWWFPQSEQV